MMLTSDKDWLIFDAVTRRRAPAALTVGDVVVVEHASGVNDAHARAVVVEAYTLCRRPGWTLLFADGRLDGFSPDDCTLFGVQPIGHVADIAGYQFRSVTHLARDWRDGRFAAAWAHTKAEGR